MRLWDVILNVFPSEVAESFFLLSTFLSAQYNNHLSPGNGEDGENERLTLYKDQSFELTGFHQ